MDYGGNNIHVYNILVCPTVMYEKEWSIEHIIQGRITRWQLAYRESQSLICYNTKEMTDENRKWNSA